MFALTFTRIKIKTCIMKKFEMTGGVAMTLFFACVILVFVILKVFVLKN